MTQNTNCKLNQLPPGIMTVKCHRKDIGVAAAAYAASLAEDERMVHSAVRRPVHLIMNPADVARSNYLTMGGDDDVDMDVVRHDDADAEQLLIESSGLHFTMTTYEYLDAVVGARPNPIVVIDRFHEFYTLDRAKTFELMMQWCIERGALIIGIKHPRCTRRSLMT